jgi:hypothetical protein
MQNNEYLVNVDDIDFSEDYSTDLFKFTREGTTQRLYEPKKD